MANLSPKKVFSILCSRVFIFTSLALLSIFVVCNFVDMRPQVSDEFFFSSEDPQFRSENLISKLFVRNDRQMIISATGDIRSYAYLSKINNLSNSLLKLEHIIGVKSLTHGPSDVEDAIKSPLWKRLLISDDKQSSNIIIFLSETVSNETITPLVEQVIEKASSDDFKLHVAGLPYVVELIRRNLLRDLKVFSLIACIIFGILIFSIFNSKGVLLGSMLSSLSACMWTLLITHILNIPVGLLTANLGTIVFIMTLSHIIFLTYNWKTTSRENSSETAIDEAIKMTFPASFWSAFTTLLGFLSLLSVQAKPLRELGAGGAIGTVVAIIVAYGMFPAFFRISHFHKSKFKFSAETTQLKIYDFLNERRKSILLVIVLLTVIAAGGLTMINADPSLLSYFSKKSEIYRGLKYIDRNGGSSPLIMVVRSNTEDKLITKQSYQQLWELQSALEQHRSIGSVISLPVLMAEAKRAPLAFFLSWKWLLDVLEKPQYDAIAKCFVSKDRKYGLFLLRMNELNRSVSRLEVVQELESLAEGQGFYPEIFGGIYILQGHLARLVSLSLILGLGKLLLAFAVIAFILSRSYRTALAVFISICFIPVIVLGMIGLYRIPLDIISAPASNIAIAIGIDSMIHMIKAYKRLGSWKKVKDELSQPILTSMFVVTLGFGIFTLSVFPPTQRFGGAILFGTILAALTALFVMPTIYDWLEYKKTPKKPADSEEDIDLVLTRSLGVEQLN